MKRFLTLALGLMLASLVSAQLPAGSTAPNFTAKDLTGRSWTLYDVLESGRPVVMDVSATWCGPCWSYHNSGALETLYETHGPDGDGQLMVFFVEGDAATNTACLYGSAGCNNSTQGNWVAGTPYPMFDYSNINGLYNINYFPTLYLITPDKKVTELGQVPATSLWTSASAAVGNIPQNFATVNDFKSGMPSSQICSELHGSPKAQLLNLGSAPITEMTVELRWNGEVIQTKTLSSLDAVSFDLIDVDFDPVTLSSVGTLRVEVTSVNGNPNAQVAGSETVFTPAVEKFTTDQVVLRIRTDANAKDIYWEMYDGQSNVVAHGGNEAVGPNGAGAFPNGSPDDPTAYANASIIMDTLDVPASGCFSFRMVDGAGNGLTFPAYYRFFELGSISYFYTNPAFGAEISNSFAKITSGVKNYSSLEASELYPNPATDEVNLELNLNRDLNVRLSILNAMGQEVYVESNRSVPGGEQIISIPVGQLANGVYFLHVQGADGAAVRRFVVNK